MTTQISSDNPSGYRVGDYLEVDLFSLVKDFVKFLVVSTVGVLLEINLDLRSVQSPLI